MYLSGARSGSLPPSSGDLGNPKFRRLVNTPLRLSSFTLPPVSASKELVGFKLNEGKSELDPVQDIQFLGLCLCLDQGRVTPRIQSSGDNS